MKTCKLGSLRLCAGLAELHVNALLQVLGSAFESMDPWQCLDADALASLLAATQDNPKQAAADLADTFSLPAYQSDVRQSLHVNFLVATMRFAAEQHFRPAQAGCLINICQQLLQAAQTGLNAASAQASTRSIATAMCC